MSEIITGNCLEVMKTFPDNHFSAIVTDPPYGLKLMGKDWDHGSPGVDFWKEALRISKTGTWLLSFGGTRTYHRLTCSIEDAGWEIRDCIMWIYGSGFPKSKGCLKPAYEPIVVARKKAPNPRLNIEECRVGTANTRTLSGKSYLGVLNDDGWKPKPMLVGSICGRWPTNVILDEASAEQVGEPARFFYCAKASRRERNEGIDADPQSAGIKNGSGRGFSELDPYKEVKYRNNHPTVKPLKLMEYLIKLVMPPKDGLLLDPFAGSGSTILAAKRLGFDGVGIEKDPSYTEIARARINN